MNPFAKTITARICQAAVGFSRLTGYARTLPSGCSDHPLAPQWLAPKGQALPAEEIAITELQSETQPIRGQLSNFGLLLL